MSNMQHIGLPSSIGSDKETHFTSLWDRERSENAFVMPFQHCIASCCEFLFAMIIFIQSKTETTTQSWSDANKISAEFRKFIWTNQWTFWTKAFYNVLTLGAVHHKCTATEEYLGQQVILVKIIVRLSLVGASPPFKCLGTLEQSSISLRYWLGFVHYPVVQDHVFHQPSLLARHSPPSSCSR